MVQHWRLLWGLDSRISELLFIVRFAYLYVENYAIDGDHTRVWTASSARILAFSQWWYTKALCEILPIVRMTLSRQKREFGELLCYCKTLWCNPIDFVYDMWRSVAIKWLIIMAISSFDDTLALCLAEANIRIAVAGVGAIHYLCGTLKRILRTEIYG